MISALVRPAVADAKRWGAILLVLAGVCWAGGCSDGGQPAAVSGKVTLAGEPVQNGSIRFDATGETISDPAAAKIENGTYQVPLTAGLQAGTYQVSVSATEVVGKRTDPETGTEVEDVKELVPEKYRGGASQLTAEISPGENTKDFDLQP